MLTKHLREKAKNGIEMTRLHGQSQWVNLFYRLTPEESQLCRFCVSVLKRSACEWTAGVAACELHQCPAGPRARGPHEAVGNGRGTKQLAKCSLADCANSMG